MYKCIVCKKELESVDEGSDIIQPMDGLHFLSYGHYGSTVYDPMNGDSIDIVICDLCIDENKEYVYGNGKEDLTS